MDGKNGSEVEIISQKKKKKKRKEKKARPVTKTLVLVI